MSPFASTIHIEVHTGQDRRPLKLALPTDMLSNSSFLPIALPWRTVPSEYSSQLGFVIRVGKRVKDMSRSNHARSFAASACSGRTYYEVRARAYGSGALQGLLTAEEKVGLSELAATCRYQSNCVYQSDQPLGHFYAFGWPCHNIQSRMTAKTIQHSLGTM